MIITIAMDFYYTINWIMCWNNNYIALQNKDRFIRVIINLLPRVQFTALFNFISFTFLLVSLFSWKLL